MGKSVYQVRAAARARGRPKIGRPSKAELVRLYVRGRLSLRDTAAALGISKDMTARTLAEYGITRRPRTWKPGRPKIGPGPETDEVFRLYILEGFSMREVGAALKLDPGAVRRRLKAAGATVRTKARAPSRLRRLDQAQLFGNIAAFGVSATAAKYGIQKRTLQYYLAGLRRELEGDK